MSIFGEAKEMFYENLLKHCGWVETSRGLKKIDKVTFIDDKIIITYKKIKKTSAK